MQEIQGNMDEVLSPNDLRKMTIQAILSVELNTKTKLEEIISDVPDLTSSRQDSSTATATFSTLLNPFFATPDLKQVAISQKPEKVSSTPQPLLNPTFLTPPPTVETPSQAPKSKRCQIQFVNYLDDVNGIYGKQKK